MTTAEYTACERCRTPALMRGRDLPRGFDAVWDEATQRYLIACLLCARAIRERASQQRPVPHTTRTGGKT